MSKDLEDGKVLNGLIKKFYDEPTGDNLYSIFLCLIDSEVQVPMNAVMSEEDAEMMKNAKPGDEVSLKNDLRLRPDWLKSPNGNLYFPIFSTIEDATEEYSSNFSWINMSIDSCIEFVDNNKESSGIVLNAFTTPIRIEGEAYEVLKNTLAKARQKEGK